MRWSAKVDSNQAEIVDALRECGACVQHLHIVGAGCPDLLVGYRGVNYLLEIKSGDGRLTPREAGWHLTWRGQVAVVRNPIEALRVIGAV